MVRAEGAGQAIAAPDLGRWPRSTGPARGRAGEALRASVISGLRGIAAGRTAVLFVATNEGIRAIGIGADGSL